MEYLSGFAGIFLGIVSSVTFINAFPGGTQRPSPDTTHKFEVARIKVGRPTGPYALGIFCRGIDSVLSGFASKPMGRCVTEHQTLRELINFAYSLRSAPGALEQTIRGGPSWIDSTFFDIEAKAENTSVVTESQLRLMLQSLLEDRFKLRFHREAQEVSGYVLLIGKDGPKLTETTHNGEGETSHFSGFSLTMGKLTSQNALVSAIALSSHSRLAVRSWTRQA
jgi:uncharacterized protein (TIGR03435 family)